MKLFSTAQLDQINEVARKSSQSLNPPKTVKKSILTDLNNISAEVEKYFKGSKSILITSIDQLHDYVTRLIEAGYAGIDTETTGLDRVHDTIVGASLYYPGGVECYIPNKHLQPLFDEPYKNQLSYEEVGKELQRIADSNVKLIFANADFDLSFILKDYKVDLCDRCYYDVILAWRVLKENEPDNALKVLYNKYVLHGDGDPKKFSDFFSPTLFPYCRPEVAKLYAANDAFITYELFKWQLQFITKDNPKCKNNHLEALSDLIWNLEVPLIRACHDMHTTGIYLDTATAKKIHDKYTAQYKEEVQKLSNMVDEILSQHPTSYSKTRPFWTGSEFNCNSPLHVKYLLYTVLNVKVDGSNDGTGKDVLKAINLPITNQILEVRSLFKLLTSFIDKLPGSTAADGRIHATFKSIGADTGRMSSADPRYVCWGRKIKLTQGRVTRLALVA